jgi:diguanylate cyclase (GGDEF)-like protein/PAS domain S-box-containing protein
MKNKFYPLFVKDQMTGKHFTSLRTKLVIMVAMGMLALFAMQFTAAQTLLLKGYSQLEQDKTLIQIGSAVSLLQEQSQQLEGIVSDWAQWDDTYQHIITPTPRYIESNYGSDTFRHLNINGVILVGLEGETLFKKGFDAESGHPWPIPKMIEQAATKGGALLGSTSGKGHASGLFWTPEGICFVSAFDVLPSNGQGPANGRLIMVRCINQSLVQHIEKILDAHITIETLTGQDLSADRMAAVTKMRNEGGMAVIPLQDQEVAGYALIENIGGSDQLIVRTVGDRRIFEQGKFNLHFLLWSMVLIALMLVIFSWLLHKLVLSRLTRLSENVKCIGDSTATTRLQELSGNDELSSLAHGINGMLERLEQTQYALHFEKERAQATLAAIADAVITSDADRRVTYMNKAAEYLTGVDLSEAKGKTLPSLFSLMSEDKSSPIDSVWLIDPANDFDEVILNRTDGQNFVIRKSTASLRDPSGSYFGAVTVLHDVTTIRSLSKQLIFQARHDALTGLINRYEFDRIAQNALEDISTEKPAHCLAYIDLDQFKVVNDTCGHMAGDMLLRQIASQLKDKMRNSDTLARLGGDEFAVLLTGCDLDKGYKVLMGLLQVVQEYRFTFDDKVFKIGASIGLTEITPYYNRTLSELLSTVDSACYAAKEEGGNRIHVSRPDDKDLKQHNCQLNWVSRIHQGLEKNQLVLYVQRMRTLKAGAEQHCELLVRMRDDDGVLYPPGYFLPVAERYHLMPLIDRWVVREALSIIARKGPDFHDICSINLSGQTLSSDGVLEYIIDQIKTHNVAPQRLCFEITETAVIANLNKAQQFIHALHKMGCRFSLDDFGSGLSSFVYLKNLDVDFLKIDGLFVRAIVNNKIDRAMVESINHVGHVIGLQNIAEFAENEDIIDILKEIGVDYAQGYGVCKPELFQ